jgi:hypothetical protein
MASEKENGVSAPPNQMNQKGKIIVTGDEVRKAFGAFASSHEDQQRNLFDEMLHSVAEMYEVSSDKPVSLRQGTKKLSANRVSVATLYSLTMYMSAHQRLLTSLINDVAEGKIGKTSRRVANSKKQFSNKKRKLEEVDNNVDEEDDGGEEIEGENNDEEEYEDASDQPIPLFAGETGERMARLLERLESGK